MPSNYIMGPEEAECVALAEYLEILKAQGKVIVYTHTAQETYTTSWKQKFKNKRMGVNSGVADYIIVTPTSVVFLEMKRLKGGVISPSQKVWLHAVKGKQVFSEVCHGFEQAKQYIDQVVKGTL